jgi:hypothetical protein
VVENASENVWIGKEKEVGLRQAQPPYNIPIPELVEGIYDIIILYIKI